MSSAKEKKNGPAHPTLLMRGAAALGFSRLERDLVLQYRPIRSRWDALPAYDLDEGDTIAFGPPDSSARPPRSSAIDARPGWQDVLAEWVKLYTPGHVETLVQRLPAHARAVIDAMSVLPMGLPEGAEEEDLKNLASLIMPARRMHITLAVACAATDMLGSVLASATGSTYVAHGAYDVLLRAPEFKAYSRLRRNLWRALRPEEYAAQRAKHSARWNSSTAGKACKRNYMQRRRQDPAYAAAERARRRKRYGEKKGNANDVSSGGTP